MRVLVTYGSKRGGTRGIAEQIGERLSERGLAADVVPVDDAPVPTNYDAAVVGGALYAMRWPRSARKFVRRNSHSLAHMPVWFFSSGPLDNSATERDIPPVRQVQRLINRVHARGHATFGGRLSSDATGFPAHAMAKEHAGDWRDPERIARWSDEIADALVAART